MLQHYLKIALRTMFKHKWYEAINIIGLTVSLTACFLIALWVNDEVSYDAFHAKADRIYRASWHARFGNNEWNIPLCPVPLGDALKNEFPEVENMARFRQGGYSVRLGDEFVREQNWLFVEESFFDVFTVEFLSGSRENALNDPNAIVITKETAERFFPGQNPIGKTIERNDGTLMPVTAVVRAFPAQSHVHFDFLVPLAPLQIFQNRKTQWGSATVYTYIALKPGERVESLEQKLKQYVEKNVVGETFSTSGNYTSFPLTTLRNIHLRSNQRYELEPNGNILYVYLFSLVAVFILVLACINFVNLATARSIKRAREVAVRKVLGSKRTQLVRQFLAESFLHVLLALAGAVVLAELTLPLFNDLAGKQLEISFFDSAFVPLTLLGLTVFVTLLAGAYPSFVLSSFWPVDGLKGGTPAQMGKERFRKVLVVLQFCISIGLIASTGIVYQQLQFIQNTRLGFDREHVLIVQRASALREKQSAFRERLKQVPAVVDAAVASYLPGQIFDSTVFELEQPANYQQTSITYTVVDEHFADVLKLRFKDGRNFSPSFASDSSAFLINEAAAQAIGWKDPLGKKVSMGSYYEGPVIGVVENFHFESLHYEVKPMLLLYNRGWSSNLAIRLRAGNIEEGVGTVKSLWEEALPNVPFEYSFLDTDYQNLYRNEERVAQVFSTFSVLAIVIACLGLFGLAAYAAEQRTKEIGIRKVLGASEAGIIRLLTQEFLLMVAIAFVISAPLSYYGMSVWLQDFAYRAEISWWVFALAGGLAFVIALLTVSVQAIRAALANPVEALRYE